MGFRFRKSVKAGPFRLNFSKSGVGWSVGGPGYRYTKKANGGTRTTLSVPGTGISHVTETSHTNSPHASYDGPHNSSTRPSIKKSYLILIVLFLVGAIVSISEGHIVGALIGVFASLGLFVFWKKSRVDNSPVIPSGSVPSSTDFNESIPSPDKAPISSVDDLVTDNFFVAGTSYRQEDISSLACENDLYSYTKKELIDDSHDDEKIYQFEFFPSNVQLIPEPENPHDKNAIKVVVDGVHIGYIKAGSCSRVRNLLNSGKITSIEAEIYGGNYKILYQDDNEKYQLETGSTPFGAKVSIIHHK